MNRIKSHDIFVTDGVIHVFGDLRAVKAFALAAAAETEEGEAYSYAMADPSGQVLIVDAERAGEQIILSLEEENDVAVNCLACLMAGRVKPAPLH